MALVTENPLTWIIVGDNVLLYRNDEDDLPTLIIPLAAWEEFLAGVRAGEFDLP
jgi:hypothetical protein